jgi:translation initiation factor 2B subunit (eIF-2B alpha/beta/delta family)
MKTNLFILIAVTLSAFACMTPNKAVSYLKKKNLLADTCAANFPVKDSIEVRESFSSDTVFVHDEDFIDIGKETNDSIHVCKPRKVIITNTIRRDSIIKTRDIAHETVLNKQIQQLIHAIKAKETQIEDQKTKISEQKDKISNLKTDKLFLWLVIAALLIYTFRRQIARLVIPFKSL